MKLLTMIRSAARAEGEQLPNDRAALATAYGHLTEWLDSSNEARERLTALATLVQVSSESGFLYEDFIGDAILEAREQVPKLVRKPFAVCRLSIYIPRRDRRSIIRNAFFAARLAKFMAMQECDSAETGVSVLLQITSWLSDLARPYESLAERIRTKLGPSKVQCEQGADRKTVNRRMLDLLQESPACQDWTVEQWAARLGCSTTAVHKSETWKAIMQVRNSRNVARVERRERDTEGPSSRNHD